MTESPADRCGYERTVSPLENCCYRKTWGDRDHCIWHAEINDDIEKPVKELQSTRETKENRRLNNGEKATIPSELLNNSQLQGTQLQNVGTFEYCWLRHADLTDADLKYATLTNSHLRNAILTNADLWHADLTGANMQGAILANACLYMATLTRSRLWHADLTGADMSGATLIDAVLWDADLTGADLGDADLTGSNTAGATFTDAVLLSTDLTNAHLAVTTFVRANLAHANLVHTSPWEADFTGANLEDADLTGADLEGADFTGAYLRDATLADAVLRDATLTHADLSTATLENADVSDASLLATNLERADFTRANLSGCMLYSARLFDTRLLDVAINDRTSFSDNCIYERWADPVDNRHPDQPALHSHEADYIGRATHEVDEERLQQYIEYAVRAATILDDRVKCVQRGRIKSLSSTVVCETARFRRHLQLSSEDVHQTVQYLDRAISVYRTRQRLYRENSLPEGLSHPFVQEKHARRKRAFVRDSRLDWFKYALSRWTMLYGESP